MTLLDAKEYDPTPARRRWKIIGLVAAVLIVAFVVWRIYRYWPEEHAINRFFQAIEAKNFDEAYGIYYADPNWKQHPDKYKYGINQFILDWGPSSEYGAITTHHIDCTLEPPAKGYDSSGVVVVVTINHIAESKSMWVEKGSRTITTSPITVSCQ
jgi:hypothetical protein